MVVNNRINCLNRELSIFDKYDIDDINGHYKKGEIKYIYRCVLNSGIIPEDILFFRLPDETTFLFVTKQVKDIVDHYKLTGATFIPIEGFNEGGQAPRI
jgi:hypothetical protein